jgi:amino acid transporter
VVYGVAIASVGGPLALAALNVPQALVDVRSSSGLLVAIGIALFAFPVVVWRRYAERVASPGGLAAYVEAAAGTATARVQAAIWIVSYFLYLPATVAYVVAELLPAAFPRIAPAEPWLEIAIPLAIVVGAAAWRTGALATIGLLAVAQVLVVGWLAAAPATHALPRVNSFVAGGSPSDLTLGAITVSLFFLCSSLPLYLGGEVRHPTTLLRRALPVSVAVGGVCVLAAAVALARVPAGLESGPFPGWAVAEAVGGRGLALAVATGTALSILSLVALEFVALTRLVPAMFPVKPDTAYLGVAGAFLAGSAIGLGNPGRFYDLVLPPMLIALFVSEAIVFAVFPRFRRRVATLRTSDVVAAGVATTLMIVGVWLAVRSSGAS